MFTPYLASNVAGWYCAKVSLERGLVLPLIALMQLVPGLKRIV
jgi:hypothetical protein